ncbi:MAG: cell wall-active antibiotics response protein [Firmicutes bacterium]|nr:cell wall-active antibiotics response protein [Bacillota bacterium]
MNPEPQTRSHLLVTPALVVGIAIIVLGLGLALDNFGFEYSHLIFRFWPVILVVLGLVKLKSCQGSCVGGYVLTGLGLLLLLKTLGRYDIGEFVGPVIVTGVGIFVVLRALKHQRKSTSEEQPGENYLQGSAIFSTFKNRQQSQTFKGGEVTTMFGGFHVDLRQSAMESQNARLDVFVMFGGGEIRVPEGWDIVVQATAIFGGIDDKTVPVPRTAEARPTLILTGLVLFGGVEVKH